MAFELSSPQLRKASTIPLPPSHVALPPIPITIFLHPCCIASAIISPTPYVVAIIGLRSFSATRVSPLAAAISIYAVYPSVAMAYVASTFLLIGPTTIMLLGVVGIIFLTHSTKPSPPSLIGRATTSSSGKVEYTPIAAALQASSADMQPLKESKARTIFFI